MLNFVIFENGASCIHRHTLDVILRVLSNRLVSKLTDPSACLGLNRTARLFLVFKKIDKNKWPIRTFG